MVTHLSDWALSFVRILGSTVVGANNAVLWGGDGAVGDVDDPLGESAGEGFTNAEQYTGPVVWRPRPPSPLGGKTVGAEGIAARKGGGLVPLVGRDLRLQKTLPPKVGTTGLSSYGGGFLSFDDTADESSSRFTLYVPYERNGQGVPQKAMSISIDPEQESMMLVHGDGYAVVIDKDNGITLRGGDSTWINVTDGTIDIVGAKVNIQGTVALGGDPATAVPLTPGPASPPGPNVYISPV
jgi:hypothetical protein